MKRVCILAAGQLGWLSAVAFLLAGPPAGARVPWFPKEFSAELVQIEPRKAPVLLSRLYVGKTRLRLEPANDPMAARIYDS